MKTKVNSLTDYIGSGPISVAYLKRHAIYELKLYIFQELF